MKFPAESLDLNYQDSLERGTQPTGAASLFSFAPAVDLKIAIHKIKLIVIGRQILCDKQT
jgi:hypothetical protein